MSDPSPHTRRRGLDSETRPAIGLAAAWGLLALGTVALPVSASAQTPAPGGPREPPADEGSPSPLVDEVGDAPLDAETLALLEALTATPTASAPELGPVWPSRGPLARDLPARRLHEGLARDLDGALELTPTLQGSLRGRLGGVRQLDHLRVEPDAIELGLLDPWLYGGARLRRGPSAANASRIWVSDVVLFGRPVPARGGISGRVAVDARTRDRGAGALGSLAVGTEAAALVASASLHGREASSASEDDLALGVSARGRLLGRSADPLSVRLGYDLALRDGGEARRSLHLAQGGLATALGELRAQITGGWIGQRGPSADADFFQVGAAARWVPEPRARFDLELLPDGAGRARARVWVRPAASPEVEIGGLYLAEDGGAGRTRAELYARTANRWGPVAVELSGRLSEQSAARGPSGPGLALDARGWLDVASPLALWARYARSYAFIETGGTPEEADLVEGGPRLEGTLGWLTVSAWAARVSRGLTEPTAIDAWGFAAEGALERGPFSLGGALSRAHLSSGGEAVGPRPVLHGRLAARATKVAWGAFFELGLRSALEAPGSAPQLALLPEPAVAPPHLVVDGRGAIDLVGGFRLEVSVTNALDQRWSPFGAGEVAPGLDLRLRLGWSGG